MCEREINTQRVLMGTLEETDCSEDLCIGRIIFKWLLNKQYGKQGLLVHMAKDGDTQWPTHMYVQSNTA